MKNDVLENVISKTIENETFDNRNLYNEDKESTAIEQDETINVFQGNSKTFDSTPMIDSPPVPYALFQTHLKEMKGSTNSTSVVIETLEIALTGFPTVVENTGDKSLIEVDESEIYGNSEDGTEKDFDETWLPPKKSDENSSEIYHNSDDGSEKQGFDKTVLSKGSCQNKSETNDNSNDSSEEKQGFERTEVSFNVTPFEQMRKAVQMKKPLKDDTQAKGTKYQFKNPSKKRNLCFKLCTHYETSFYLTCGEMCICRNYQHRAVKRNLNVPDTKLAKKRDPFIIALLDVLRTKYSEYNNLCYLNFWSHNETKYGWTFYGWCMYKTCKTYKIKITKIREDTGSIKNDEHLCKVEVFVDRLKANHDSKLKVEYVKGMYILFFFLNLIIQYF